VAKKKATERIEVTDRESKLRAVEQLAQQINNNLGVNVVFCNSSPLDTTKVYSTRVPSLDIATGVGGIPRGRITEIFGPERSGKTTVALQVAATAQSAGDVVLYVDAEHALDKEYCNALGLDIDDKSFIIVQPNYGEQGLDVVLKYLDQSLADLVIIDSLASLMPKSMFDAILEDGMTIQRVGERARMLTKFVDAAVSLVNTSNSTLLLLQQMRTKITAMGAQETTASPLAVKHEESLRIEIRRVKDEIKGNATDETLYGTHQVSRAKVVKNKVAKPFRQSIFDVIYGLGADYAQNLLLTCVAKDLPDVVLGSMGWVTIIDPATGEQLAKFRKTQSREFLDEHRDIASMLNEKLSHMVGISLYDVYNPTKEIGPLEVPEPIELMNLGEYETEPLAFGEPVEPSDDVEV